MGLFKNMKNMQQQAQSMQQQARDSIAANQGATQQAMNDPYGAAYAELAQKLHTAGVEAPGVIHAIRPSGNVDMSGGQQVEFDVSIKPADGEPYQTTIMQAMLPAQMEDLSEGKSITVKYDPDSPTSALMFGW